MTTSADAAAKALCQACDWQLTSLQLHKILYLVHVAHMGTTGGEPLIEEGFVACDLGVVSQALHERTRIFGDRPVRNIFHGAGEVTGRDAFAIERAAQHLGKLPIAELVALAQGPESAWAHCYWPGDFTPIPNALIMADHERLFGGVLLPRKTRSAELDAAAPC